MGSMLGGDCCASESDAGERCYLGAMLGPLMLGGDAGERCCSG